MKTREKVSVITLGCAKNIVDSERLLRQLQLNNLDIRKNPNEADTVVINTCGFIEAAKEESVNTILQTVANKKSGAIKKVFVAGCLSQRYKEELQKEIPEVDMYFGTEDYERIINQLDGELKYNLLGERFVTTPFHTAYLKISEGCDRPCSFCAIPLMRGKNKSKSIDDLIDESKYLATNNTKELVLIAQDTTDYGNDLYNERNISNLIRKISEVDGIEWIRLMYAYPSRFPEELIDEIANNKKVCNYIDMPLQHIADNVLKSMRRGITGRQTRELIYKLRKRIPDLVLRTTILVGYPNETKDDFDELYEFIKEIKFERLGTFTYSQEENTNAYNLGDMVPQDIKNERQNKIMELQKDISLEKNKELINKELKVLVEAVEGDFYIGRSYRDAPDVDGEVLIKLDNGEIKAGEFCNVKVYDCNEYDLFARVI
ncbi:MAG: 30S ribosomal protein S12 methylthiotransferase RimO [Ignavibacteria bacterium]|nr:30S ribosomal protein S12 methylthiotransferase RimO [Ignavibacteria bacterium]MBT8381521.1 30S ribosomal protein S12 methylthiotransferase RimO [Ignavibacteria bacterium]MBT8391351.1 30S ribosomal protein S12 methylthiotransferase RimO [Ignavibacteria bacterium]NNJ53021.1 30S ribosomal protein S12 methylthiotransferase RimO [Ignavibacteriaceae bacterium]NNL21464.1 30S ribosomal protein S12 methylthiotransferase RimO [Ignavibacteriaceae bacterium]